MCDYLIMSKSVIKLVGGQEFALRTDNETMLDSVVDEVSSYLANLKKTVPQNTTAERIAVMASLNIAENHYIAREKLKAEHDFFCQELDSMCDFLEGLNISRD